MDRHDVFLVLFVVLVAVLFVGGALSIYDVTLKIKRSEEKIFSLQSKLERSNNSLKIVSERLEATRKNTLASKKALRDQIDTLEKSIEPENKMWAKIRMVRGVIQDQIKRFGYSNSPDIRGLNSLSHAIIKYSDEYDVPVPLILAVIKRESAFNQEALSHAGARGLMQLMPYTAKECADDIGKRYFGITNIQDNVQLGTWYLAKMIREFDGDLTLAIRAYNAGPKYAWRFAKTQDIHYEETEEYVKIVMQYQDEFKKLGVFD